jgi:hypothetical protein
MRTLAINLKSQGKEREAIPLLEACYQLYKDYLGEQFLTTRITLQVLEKWHKEGRISLVLVIARKVLNCRT